jgi:hypothetical protein
MRQPELNPINKNFRLENFSEKIRKLQTYNFCQKGQKNYQADVLPWLAY